jgi:glycosyltransferase involved in cell wall biosynthesis
MKKKVLHLITGLEHGGGAEASLVKTLPFLEKTNVAVCAMTGRGEDGKALERADVEVFYLDMKGKFDVRGVWRYYQVLRAYQPDVQVNYLIHADIFGRIFGKLFRVPKIISYIRNHHVGGLYERLDRATFPLADFVLTNSEANLRYYHKNYKLSAKKSACIPNAVELPDISKNNRENVGLFKKDENIPDALLVITCVARLHPQKSHETLFHALRRLKDGGTQVQALLVGEGQERENLEKLRDALDLEKEILFLGERSDVPSILSASDIFVLPSLFEGMSNALLEAMSSGLACVASNIPANSELIKTAKNGLLFNPRDSEDLAKKFRTLMADPELRARLGEEARKTVQKKYNIETIREQLDDFFYEQSV